jgi:predicted phage terminase large subunit-like protein
MVGNRKRLPTNPLATMLGRPKGSGGRPGALPGLDETFILPTDLAAAAEAAPTQADERERAIEEIRIAKRFIKIKRARTSLRDFIELCMPDPERPGDTDFTQFRTLPHHLLLIETVEKVERGEIMRSATSIPPQHGKSTILSQFGVAWIIGKNPHKRIIVGTYGEDRAQRLGTLVREIVRSDTFRQVFPEFALIRGGEAKDELVTTAGGSILFVGRGTATTGEPCDLFMIDDPLKDQKEAKSPAVRLELHEWYSAVVFSRCHVLTPIVIVHTRWHEDDLIGRQCDPDHPDNKEDPERAEDVKRWAYINIPAIVDDPDLAAALGIEPGSALWPERFPLSHLAEARRNNPQIFAALYLGKPSPDEGDFFTKDMIVTYKRGQLPKELRFYAASDHAVGEKQRNDKTCLMVVGVDSNDEIWVLPDLYWKRAKTDVVVERMIDLMLKHDPAAWWAEKGHISKSIGPFLKKRMRERKCFTMVSEETPVGDKQARAQSIQARMSMSMVHFPDFAPWWQDARAELLKFPNSRHDDFVDALAWVGLGLQRQIKTTPKKSKREVMPGTMGWIKKASEKQRAQSERSLRLRNM